MVNRYREGKPQQDDHHQTRILITFLTSGEHLRDAVPGTGAVSNVIQIFGNTPAITLVEDDIDCCACVEDRNRHVLFRIRIIPRSRM